MLIIGALITAGLVALTHFGTTEPGEPGVVPTIETSAPSIASGPDGAAQALVLKGLDAERVFYVDNVRFAAAVGAELEELRRADPNLPWGRDVFVVVPASEAADAAVVVVRAASTTGRVFCGAEVSTPQDAGTWYAATAGAPCPPVAKGMPGWSTNQAVGWL